MSLRRILLTFVFTEISNQQLHAFICRDVCNIRMLHWKQHGSAKQVPEIVRILSFVSSFSFNGCKYRINIHVFCKVGVTKKYFLTCFISSPFLFQCCSGESSSYMVCIRSYLVKRCNKKNDLRSF